MSFANGLTFARIFIVPFFFTELLTYREGFERHRWMALGLFAIASLTDALDGFIARVTRTRTSLGRFLDPFADKLLLLSGFLGILFVEALPFRPPLWVTVTIVFRDFLIIAGLVVLFLVNGSIEVRPNFLGKATTAFQMVTLIAILLGWKFSFLLWNVTAILTIFSGLTYIYRELKVR